MNRAEADRFIEDTKRTSAEFLVENGDHDPTAFVFPPAGVDAAPLMIHLGGAMGSAAGKDAATDMIRNLVRETGAVGVVMLIEGWVSTPPPSGPLMRPSKDPLRREALVLSWEFRVPDEPKKVQGVWLRFFHHEGERIVLGETQDWSGEKSVGRFVEFLE